MKVEARTALFVLALAGYGCTRSSSDIPPPSPDGVSWAGGTGEDVVSGSGGGAQQVSEWEVLYHSSGTAGIHHVSVESDHLYFTQGGGIARLPLSGGEPQEVGSAADLAPALTSNSEAVYWLDENAIFRRDAKAVGRFVLPWRATAVFATEEHVYAASRGCAAVLRLTSSLEGPEIVTAREPLLLEPGGTHLEMSDGTLLCGGTQGIAAIETWSGEFEFLDVGAKRVDGLTSAEGRMYWAEIHGDTWATQEVKIFSADLQAPVRKNHGTLDVREAKSIAWDDEHESLLVKNMTIRSVDPKSGEAASTRLTPHRGAGPIVADGWVYWVHSPGTHLDLVRLRLKEL